MRTSILVEPNQMYKKSFEHYVLAYDRINDKHYYSKYKKALENFHDYIDDLHNSSIGKDLREGKVASSTFWLIDKNEVVGVVRVRHEEVDTAGHIGYDISPDYRNKGYGYAILQLALEEAIKLGLKEVIVTCNTENIASKKIIEKNHGVLLGTIYDEEENEYLYKYRIVLATNL